MQYQETDYTTETDGAPWTAAPVTTTRSVTRVGDGQMVPAPAPTPVVVQPSTPNMSEMLVIGSLIQSMQHAQTQQMYVLRDIDARLARVEDNARYAAAAPAPAAPQTFERATWWAIWGLLMLILGGALAVVTLLILLNIQFR